MRPLTESETSVFFEKLAKYIGRNIKELLEPREGEEYCFRVHKNKVYYMSVKLMNHSNCVKKDRMRSCGVCFGNFTKAGRFNLRITALDYLAQYAQYKIWLKMGNELSFLYGKHVLKAHVAKITEQTPQYQGVVVFNQRGVPLGFGVTAKSTAEIRALDPVAIVCFHQEDSGEYLRAEGVSSIF